MIRLFPATRKRLAKVKSMKYTCTEYRVEMILVSLKQRLRHKDLDEAERKDILSQIETLEADMDLD